MAGAPGSAVGSAGAPREGLAMMAQHELDRLVASLRDGPQHERLYRDLIRRSGIAISPAESWVLWHVAAHGPITASALAARLGLDSTGLSALFEALGRRGYLRRD